jgi:hypothetical protein
VTTISNVSFDESSKPQDFTPGDLVIFNPKPNTTLTAPRSFVLMVTKPICDGDLSGIVVWSEPELSRSHPVGKYSENWMPHAFEPFKGTLTLESN